MSGITLEDVLEWPEGDKLLVYGQLRNRKWKDIARPEQQEPPGDWVTWYLMGGRGSGKSRTGAETFCGWITSYPSGEWAIIGPTFADARDTCVESDASGILPILGPLVSDWNRSLGELKLHNGSRIYLDGADDGALRIQGKNLRGAWCDEVGLWKKWDIAWNESLAFAVRHAPGKRVATGTPKMGHGLVKMLVEDPKVPVSRMSTRDNIANLNEATVEELYTKYQGTRLGNQELEGEWVAEIEGDILKRAWWRYYDRSLLGTTRDPGMKVKLLPNFSLIVVSVDTPLKDKETSDYVAIQAWGVMGADRYMLDTRVDRMSYDQAKRAVTEMSNTMRRTFRTAQHRVLIENAGYGSDLIIDLKRTLGGMIEKIQAAPEGSKTMRAIAASDDLEGGNCFLPGAVLPDLSGPDGDRCPAFVMQFVHQAAIFPEVEHDDEVDAWSQCMNWLRTRQPSPLRSSSMLLRRASPTTSRRRGSVIRSFGRNP